MAYSNADMDASPFPFFKLPPEIRNAIYSLSSQNLYSHKRSHRPVLNGHANSHLRRQQMAYNNSEMIRQPALFRSCPLARSEGLPLHYRECRHIFERHSTGESDTIILDWLRAIAGQGFSIQRLHILIACPSYYHHWYLVSCDISREVLRDIIGVPLRNFTKEIYSILPQDLTLFYSDYYRTSFLNGSLVDVATYIHSLKDWLSVNGADAPVFRFRESSAHVYKTKTLSHVQQLDKECNEIFQNTPATLIASSQTAYYPTKRSKRSRKW